MFSSRWDCRGSHRGWKRKRTGTACSRSANSNVSGSPARCCTRRNYLFLDEATASLDEASEAALYRLIQEKLPATTVVSIGHRSTLEAFHQRNVVLAREGDRFTLQNQGERRRARNVMLIQLRQTKGRQIALPPFLSFERKTYFRLVIAVRSAESLTMPAAPHQFEPVPPGLIGVTLVVPEAL